MSSSRINSQASSVNRKAPTRSEKDRQEAPVPPGKASKYKEKFYSLRGKYEAVTGIYNEHQKELAISTAKLRKLQDECDVLLDTIALSAGSQPSLTPYLHQRTPSPPPIMVPYPLDVYQQQMHEHQHQQQQQHQQQHEVYLRPQHSQPQLQLQPQAQQHPHPHHHEEQQQQQQQQSQPPQPAAHHRNGLAPSHLQPQQQHQQQTSYNLLPHAAHSMQQSLPHESYAATADPRGTLAYYGQPIMPTHGAHRSEHGPSQTGPAPTHSPYGTH